MREKEGLRIRRQHLSMLVDWKLVPSFVEAAVLGRAIVIVWA